MKTLQSILADFIKRNNIHSILDEKGGSTKWYKFLEVRMALNMNLDNLINDLTIRSFVVNGVTEEYISKGSLTILLLNSKTKYSEELYRILEECEDDDMLIPNNRWDL